MSLFSSRKGRVLSIALLPVAAAFVLAGPAGAMPPPAVAKPGEPPPPEECVPHTELSQAGVADDFKLGNGTEKPSPSDGLLQYIAGNYAHPGSRDFDSAGPDRWFGHTFTGLAPAGGATICGAKLTTRIGQGGSAGGYNDSLGLFFTGPTGKKIGSSVVIPLSSLGIANGSSATVGLDLSSLPGGADLLPEIAQNGFLDFIVQDDSAVDFVDLEVEYCCACTPHTDVLSAGTEDDFSLSNGPEVPSPSDGLQTFIAQNYAHPGSRNFDQITADRWFAHTFTGFATGGPEGVLCGARLVTAVGHDQVGSYNDSLGLFFTDPSGKQEGSSFVAPLSTLGAASGSSSLVTLDLTSLPGGLDLLPELAQNGFVDFIVQDDTAVDFARLELDYCCIDKPWPSDPKPVVDPALEASGLDEVKASGAVDAEP